MTDIQKLEKKVFIFDSSEGDKRFFKQALSEYEHAWGKGLKDYLWSKVWERNDCGKTIKYLYFNERSQRLYLDREFFEWCCKVLDAQSELKTKINRS